ncbi:MAG TPA: DedA family protein [Clostridia bacterium]|nr:DedA family protein [Clostridia bacterium]
MQEFIIEIMNRFGYWGVGVLIAIENIFPPIPSEVILIFGGFMTTYSNMNVWILILAATIGSVGGAVILYSVGRLIHPEYLKKLFSGRIGQILHLEVSDLGKAGGWFARKGNWAVFLCRFVPIIRSLISIPAGMAKMNLGVFFLLTTMGTASWNTALVWLGVFAGESWEKTVQYTHIYSRIVLILVGLAVFIGGIIFYKKRLNKQEKQ